MSPEPEDGNLGTPLSAAVVAALDAAIPAGALLGERYNEQHWQAVEE